MTIPWPVTVTWLWLTKPRWMIAFRRETKALNGIYPVRPHTFG